MTNERHDEGTRAALLTFLRRTSTFGRGDQKQAVEDLLNGILPLFTQYGILAKYDRLEDEWNFQHGQVRARLVLQSGLNVFVSKPGAENVRVVRMPDLDFDPTIRQFVGPVLGRDLARDGHPVRASAQEALVEYVLGLLSA